jgi:hypothetical protein
MALSKEEMVIGGVGIVLIILWLLLGKEPPVDEPNLSYQEGGGGNTYPTTQLGPFQGGPVTNVTVNNPPINQVNNYGCPCTNGLDSQMVGTLNKLLMGFEATISNIEDRYLSQIQSALPAWMSQMINNQAGAIASMQASETYQSIGTGPSYGFTGPGAFSPINTTKSIVMR